MFISYCLDLYILLYSCCRLCMYVVCMLYGVICGYFFSQVRLGSVNQPGIDGFKLEHGQALIYIRGVEVTLY